MSRIQTLPVEIRLQSGVSLRGHEHSRDGAPVVFIHDLHDDLDSWGDIPARVADLGFRTVTLELRGHGLSDGEPDPRSTPDDLQEALGIISETFGPAGLAAYGSVASAALLLGAEQGAPVQVLVSPLPYPGEVFDPANTAPATRALFVGAKDQSSDRYLRSIYAKLKGQNMWFSTGVSDQGVDLLMNRPHFVEQSAMFLRRYLTGYHLAWLAQHQMTTDATGADTQDG